MTYRVREAVVEVCIGSRCWRARRFIAERRVRLLGVLPVWWPVANGEWRRDSDLARADAEGGARLRKPLSAPIVFECK